jgi:HlyD family secretion protein
MTVSKAVASEASLERLSTPEQLDLAIKVIPSTGWFALMTLAALVVSMLIGSLLIKVPITIRGDGIILGGGGVLDVMSETDGRVVKFYVKPGEEVHAGQMIAELDLPDLAQARNNAVARLAEAREALDQLTAQHEREKASKTAQFAERQRVIDQNSRFTQDRLNWLIEKEKEDRGLLEKRLIPRQSYIDTEVSINDARQKLSSLENDVKQLRFEQDNFRSLQERELLDRKEKLAEAQRESDTLAAQLARTTEIDSPYDGRIVEFKANPGDMIGKSMPLVGMLPPGATGVLHAVIYAQPADGKKVRPGMEVQIEPTTVRREEFGFILGRVRQVAEIPSTTQGMMRVLKNSKLVEALSGRSAPFEIDVELIRSPDTPSGFKWSSSTGPNLQINSGTPCGGEVAVRHQRLISLAIPAMEQLLPSE